VSASAEKLILQRVLENTGQVEWTATELASEMRKESKEECERVTLNRNTVVEKLNGAANALLAVGILYEPPTRTSEKRGFKLRLSEGSTKNAMTLVTMRH